MPNLATLADELPEPPEDPERIPGGSGADPRRIRSGSGADPPEDPERIPGGSGADPPEDPERIRRRIRSGAAGADRPLFRQSDCPDQ